MKWRAGPRWGTIAAGVVIAILSSAGREAEAGSVTYAFDTANTNSLTTPYGTLNINADSTTGKVVFTLTAPANENFVEFAFNSVVSTSEFTVNGGTPSGGNVSTFGNFDVDFADSSSTANPFVVTVQFKSGDFGDATIANFTTDLSTHKGGGFTPSYFAAHLKQPGITGFVAITKLDPVSTPEPSTMILAAIGGVMGLGARLRGRRRLA